MEYTLVSMTRKFSGLCGVPAFDGKGVSYAYVDIRSREVLVRCLLPKSIKQFICMHTLVGGTLQPYAYY